MRLRARFLSPLIAFVLAGCGSAVASHWPVAAVANAQHRLERQPLNAHALLKHIVVVIQENRTVDNLFNGFCLPNGPCADTVTVDRVSGTPLAVESLAAPFGASHSHDNFVQEYDYGKMDGFRHAKTSCKKGYDACPYSVLSYVPANETQIYRKLATVDGVFSDRTFQADQGPSFPSHLYAIAGQSGGYDPDHWAIMGGSGSCGEPKNDIQILMSSSFPGETGHKVPSCKDFPTIFDELTAKAGHTWRYYSNSTGGFFSATQSIRHLYNSPNFIVPSMRFLKDVEAGHLADVTFIMPWTIQVSDHPGNVRDPQDGPDWVGSVVNAIGESPFWKDTAVVIWWDDWGGFYDHVAPPTSPLNPDPFEYGFRVPMIVVSSYARIGTIDHTPRTFVSALRLIEETFELPSLGTTDRFEPDGLDAAFDFNAPPIRYTPVGGPPADPLQYYQHMPAGPHHDEDDDS